MEKNSENQAVIDAMKRWGETDVIGLDAAEEHHVLLVPEGRTIKSIKPFLDEYLNAPERTKGTATLTTLESFIAHVMRSKDVHSAIFADDAKKAPGLLAVYDYNRPSDHGGATALGISRFGEHRARYTFPLSDEWNAWTAAAASPEPMGQQAFAEFLEDRIVDVIDPTEGVDRIKEFAVNLALDLATPQRLMTLSRGLSLHVGHQVTNAVAIGSGEGQITFTEEHKSADGGQLRVPGGFAIKIPIFRGDDAYQIGVRLRYRHQRGAISWTVNLHRADAMFTDAFDIAVAAAAKATGLPIFCGSPEK